MENVSNGVRRRPVSAGRHKKRNDFTVKQPKSAFGRFISKFFRIGRGMDLGFFGVVVLLAVIGLVMLYSASYPISYYENDGDSDYIFMKQCGLVIAGVVIMFLVSFFKYEIFKRKKMVYFILGVSYLGLIIVGVRAKITGEVVRWLNVGFRIQASEISKFALILFFSYFCDKYFANDKKILSVGAFTLITTAGLLWLEPHYSGIVIISMIIFVMMFLGGVKVRWFAIAGAFIAVVAIGLYATGALGYAMQRLEGWGQALTAEYGTELYETTRQTRNSMYAIGSGGLTGLGFGESRQKYLFLPEPQNDFIFAIVCEELGFVGAVLILALFALLICQGVRIAQHARDRFGRLLGAGLMMQIGLQVVLNLLVITDVMPNTGISLPFFSSGGSSLIMFMIQMGLVLSISRTANIEKL